MKPHITPPKFVLLSLSNPILNSWLRTILYLPKTIYYLVGIYFSKNKNSDQIRSNLSKLLQLEVFLPSWLYHRLGHQLLRHNQLEEAQSVFRRYTEQHPSKLGSYQCWVKIAKLTQHWDNLYEHLTEAIDLFPHQLNFVHEKKNLLYHIGQIHEVFPLIQKAKINFPDNSSLDIAEAEYFQKIYDYLKARTVLHAAIQKYPTNGELELAEAHNYWLIGDYKLVKERLQRFHSKLDFSKSVLPYKFVIPYLDSLLYLCEYEKLQNFLEQTRLSNIVNRGVIIANCQWLISKEEYDKAKEYIESLSKLPTGKINIANQALLLFELEKIKNIEALKKGNASTLSQYTGESDFGVFLEKLVFFLKNHLQFALLEERLKSVFDKLETLVKKHPVCFMNTAISPLESYRIAQEVTLHIRKKIPFSFIRLGDGEGHYLDYVPYLQSFQKNDRTISQRIWWGEPKINETDWKNLKNTYLNVIQEADILGIPCPWRCARTFLQLHPQKKYLAHESRGIMAILDTLLARQGSDASTKLPILTSCHIHSHLEDLGLWDMILGELENCSVISCHPSIGDVLKEKYGLNVRKMYAIPTEYKYAQLFGYNGEQEHNHYPYFFKKICEELNVAYRGEVFLVAAGFLGKFYCHLIKQKGGIALDVGSAMDYWLGYKTRVWTKYPNPITFEDLIPFTRKL